MKKCLDEGLLQSYVDGELSPDMMQEAAEHISHCGSCVEALASARNDSAFFAGAFASDEFVSVPTEQLRARVNAAVARLESSEVENSKRAGRSLSAALSSLSGLLTFTPRRAAAFAAFGAVVLLATMWAVIQRVPAVRNSPQVAQGGAEPPTRVGDEVRASADSLRATPEIVTDAPTSTPVIMKVTGTRPNGRISPRRAATAPATPAPELKELLSSEKQYQASIASMSKTIEMGGDAVLRPAVRADYERNLAVLDRAIAETRGVALRHPKDKDAVNFLLSAYQSKVELLTTVADQAQVATLGR